MALVVMIVMGLVGLLAPIVWSPVSYAIDSLGGLISAAGLAGVFGYGFLERLLIPTGLHHVLNGIFRTTSIGGIYEGVEGCLNIFLDQTMGASRPTSPMTIMTTRATKRFPP